MKTTDLLQEVPEFLQCDKNLCAMILAWDICHLRKDNLFFYLICIFILIVNLKLHRSSIPDS